MRGRSALAWVAAVVVASPLVVACSSTPDEPGPSTSPSSTTSPTGTTAPEAGASCGAAGPKCADGARCTTPADCTSASCQGGTCTKSSCDNRAQDGTETGVDCGGSCAKCDGEGCASDGDCKSTTCGRDGKCAPAGTKTCGVGVAVSCKAGEPCGQDRDCESDYCRALACSAPPAGVHQDGRRNAGETGVDCGGTAAPERLCGGGQKCVTSDDCLSKCTNLVCDPPSATDGKKNNGETDVDCGGPNAPKCAVDKVCAVDGDCGLDLCSEAKVCGTPTAEDGKKNGGESDVDCGGAGITFGGVTVPPAPRCEATRVCVADGDCFSGACAFNKKCVEGPSCRNLNGGQTCGVGEVGGAGTAHESCCRTLPVPGLTMTHAGVTKQVYVDKYEITAGRVRAWVADIKRQYAGVPNVRAWVDARVLTDALVATQINATNRDHLPTQDNNQIIQMTPGPIDIGMNSQIGPTSYYRGWTTGGTSGCYLGANGFGHRTYWFDAALSASFNEVPRDVAMRDILDQKSMNCMTPIMFAAFCAWDGGYMISQAAIAAAYGPSQWPWGDTPSATDTVSAYANFNPNTSFNATKAPTYLFPLVNYATFANDMSPIIAAPGRFANDLGQVKPIAGSNESWMDLGGNMIEWSNNNGTFHGWTGSSFEGHNYPRQWNGTIVPVDKYGKGGARCMRLR